MRSLGLLDGPVWVLLIGCGVLKMNSAAKNADLLHGDFYNITMLEK